MSEPKVVRDLVELFEDLHKRNERDVDVLGAWGEGRASAFKLASDHCRNVLLYVCDENLYDPNETDEGES